MDQLDVAFKWLNSAENHRQNTFHFESKKKEKKKNN